MIWNNKYWSNKAFLIVTIALSVIMLLFCYVAWNLPYSIGEVNSLPRKSAWLKRNIVPVDDNTEVLAINIAYDKQFVSHYDEYGIPDGTIDITDREKLYRLFSFLNENQTYRYVVCDIDFSGNYSTPYDSLLFNLLAQMPRICLSSSGEPIEQLDRISCVVEYQVRHAGDGFMQYKYTTSDRQSIPVRMWQDLDHGQYQKHWYGYTRNGQLCSDGVIPDMRFSIENTYDEKGRKQIYNLGADILPYALTNNGALFADKIVLIGDWTENDMHDTLRAQQPGIAILYNAYICIKDGINTLSWVMLIALLILFWAVSVVALWEKNAFLSMLTSSMHEKIEKNIILKIGAKFFSITISLKLIFVIIYFVWGRYINILAIGIVLTILSLLL